MQDKMIALGWWIKRSSDNGTAACATNGTQEMQQSLYWPDSDTEIPTCTMMIVQIIAE